MLVKTVSPGNIVIDELKSVAAVQSQSGVLLHGEGRLRRKRVR